MREKDRGIWQTYDLARAIATTCATSRSGWRRSGFKRGDKLSVRRRQPAAALLGAARRPGAGRHVGAGLPGFDRHASWSTCSNHAEVSVIVAEDQEQVDKVAVAQGPAAEPALDRVYDDPRGMCAYDDPMLRSFDERAGGRARAFGKAHPGLLRAPRSPRAAPTTWRMIAYTSGTTGSPKGAMLSHAT